MVFDRNFTFTGEECNNHIFFVTFTFICKKCRKMEYFMNFIYITKERHYTYLFNYVGHR